MNWIGFDDQVKSVVSQYLKLRKAEGKPIPSWWCNEVLYCFFSIFLCLSKQILLSRPPNSPRHIWPANKPRITSCSPLLERTCVTNMWVYFRTTLQLNSLITCHTLAQFLTYETTLKGATVPLTSDWCRFHKTHVASLLRRMSGIGNSSMQTKRNQRFMAT